MCVHMCVCVYIHMYIYTYLARRNAVYTCFTLMCTHIHIYAYIHVLAREGDVAGQIGMYITHIHI